MTANRNTRVHLENVFVVVQMNIHFLPVHDLRRASLAASPSNRLKVKDVLHLLRLRQDPLRAPSLRHSLRRMVPREEVKVRRTSRPTSLPPSLPLSLPRNPLRKREKFPLTMMTLRRRIRMRNMTGVRKRKMSLRRTVANHAFCDTIPFSRLCCTSSA